MGQTPVLGLPYGGPLDSPDGAAQIEALAEATENAVLSQVSTANRLIARFKSPVAQIRGPTWQQIGIMPEPFTTLPDRLYCIDWSMVMRYGSTGSTIVFTQGTIREGGTILTDEDGDQMTSPWMPLPLSGTYARSSANPAGFHFWRPTAGAHTLNVAFQEASNGATVTCQSWLRITDYGPAD